MLTTPFLRKLSFFKFFVVYLTTIRPLLTWFPSKHRFPLSHKLDHFWFVRKSAKKRFATPPPTKSSSLNIKLHHPVLITPLFHPRPTLLMVVAALPLGVVVVVAVALVADKDTTDPPNPDSSTLYPSFRPPSHAWVGPYQPYTGPPSFGPSNAPKSPINSRSTAEAHYAQPYGHPLPSAPGHHHYYGPRPSTAPPTMPPSTSASPVLDQQALISAFETMNLHPPAQEWYLDSNNNNPGTLHCIINSCTNPCSHITIGNGVSLRDPCRPHNYQSLTPTPSN